ncbi:BIIDXI-like protein At5g11420 isoform X3 [Carex rostrata]
MVQVAWGTLHGGIGWWKLCSFVGVHAFKVYKIVGWHLGLLPNGNFEQVPKPTDLNGTELVNTFALPHWKISGFVEYIESGHKQGDLLLVIPEGTYAVRLGNEASIKQWLNVSRGNYYAISFSAARTCAQSEKLNVSVSPESGTVPMQTIYSSNGWDLYAWGFQAKRSEVELVIHNPGMDDDPACGPIIDSVAIQTLNPPRLTKYNVVKNGDFEEGPYLVANTSWGVLIPPIIEDDHSPLPAWMVESLKAVKFIDSNHYSVPHGKRAVELVAGRESALAQVVRTILGKTYSLTFSVSDAADGCIGSMMVEAYADRGMVDVPYESNGIGGHKKAGLQFVATGNRTRVVFLSNNYHMKFDGSLCGPVIDDVLLLSVRNPGRKLL